MMMVRARTPHRDHRTEDGAAVEAARRSRRPGWRDPRILAGLGLMAVSVLGGAALLQGADDTDPILMVRRPVGAGAPVSPEDLVTTRVRFADPAAAGRYLAAVRELPDGAVATRPLRSGELLATGAVAGGTPEEAGLELPLAVGAEDLPATVRRGSVVDVWAVPDGATGSAGRPRLLLGEVTVLRVSGATESLSPQPTRQVIVGVPDDEAALTRALRDVGSARLLVLRRP